MSRAAAPNPNIHRGEYLPKSPEKHNSAAPNPNTQRVGYLAGDDEDEKVIQYHQAAERCGHLSIWCAAMAGAEIIRKKQSLGHGNGFVAWKRALPFGETTAHNYMNLAKRLEAKLKALPESDRAALLPQLAKTQRDASNALQLLDLPSPMDVFDPAHERISKLIRHVTNEQTLRQLYFDWEIVKAPAEKGGANQLNKFLREKYPNLVGTPARDLPKNIHKEFLQWKHAQTLSPEEQVAQERTLANEFWRKFLSRFHFNFYEADDLLWTNTDCEIRQALLSKFEEASAAIRKTLR